MRILVTASSKHGATAEIADAIAGHLAEHGYDVLRKNPQDVTSLDGVDAVVCGSAVYMMTWMEQAHDFMDRFASELEGIPVWAFSVGMNGVPAHVPQDPSRIGPVLTKVKAIEHRVFPGRYIPSLLNLRERTIVRLAGAVEGDFRDWDVIEEWSRTIAETLSDVSQ
ncbi:MULTISPECIES: flavodoxin domain-containing protein [unclassified Schaalia]|uniref:flavodoxin domain-containing protein n=1 Tax=unclassified Schaalia TaxID=2691889 RepID=UPI001E51FAC5|nr:MULTISPECIES: flavodoxin domain-containing protein [unclassified Schaalia]MCD4550150.1 flavodoxin domain-containing protein [Schaalia sp. lx-260]MCD4557430.1 flavodoxin domain-containing protein [Schaalia sp. lx-100]